MHKDVIIAAIGNPAAWLAAIATGMSSWAVIAAICASSFTALYFCTKWIREIYNWHRELTQKTYIKPDDD